jgi:hypothetical protein
LRLRGSVRINLPVKGQEENMTSTSKHQPRKKIKRISLANQVDMGGPGPAAIATKRLLVEGLFIDLKTRITEVIKYSQQICDN